MPRFTDDSDHLCGVRALVESLNFTRAAIARENGETPPRVLSTDAVEMRRLLFESEDTSAGRFRPDLGKFTIPFQRMRLML